MIKNVTKLAASRFNSLSASEVINSGYLFKKAIVYKALKNESNIMMTIKIT